MAANQRKKKTNVGHLVLHVVLLLSLAMFMFPLYWLIVSSFKPMNMIFRMPFEWLPSEWTLQHYKAGWHFMGSVTFGRVFFNSFFVTGVAVVATIVTASMVAFGFARIPFRGRNFWFVVLLATMMLPSQVTLVPTYTLYDWLGLIDKYAALYIGAFFGGGAFFIFLVRQFIMGLPIDLDESARIDGASTFRIFRQIIFPLCSPVLITVVILQFSWTYNDFFSPLIFISSIEKFTIPVAINTFMDESGSGNIGKAIAMTTVSIMPLIILFFVMQKQFMQGIATTGLKG
ncbi:carbohydrate ABC transporter permease [Cohnella sp. GCM10027633]|uniref:carbohydrate ABC transporter permease n=1 Tax=unclassified Cohnella TaxID=2636738 RepID=UPI00363E7B5E